MSLSFNLREGAGRVQWPNFLQAGICVRSCHSGPSTAGDFRAERAVQWVGGQMESGSKGRWTRHLFLCWHAACALTAPLSLPLSILLFILKNLLSFRAAIPNLYHQLNGLSIHLLDMHINHNDSSKHSFYLCTQKITKQGLDLLLKEQSGFVSITQLTLSYLNK